MDLVDSLTCDYICYTSVFFFFFLLQQHFLFTSRLVLRQLMESKDPDHDVLDVRAVR